MSGVSASASHEGWLRKKGDGPLPFQRSWNRFWFRLEGAQLLYSDDQRSRHPKGEIDLNGAFISVANHSKYENYFQITTSPALGSKTFAFTAPSPLSLFEWVSKFERAGSKGEIRGLRINKGPLLEQENLRHLASPLQSPPVRRQKSIEGAVVHAFQSGSSSVASRHASDGRTRTASAPTDGDDDDVGVSERTAAAARRALQASSTSASRRDDGGDDFDRITAAESESVTDLHKRQALFRDKSAAVEQDERPDGDSDTPSSANEAGRASSATSRASHTAQRDQVAASVANTQQKPAPAPTTPPAGRRSRKSSRFASGEPNLGHAAAAVAGAASGIRNAGADAPGRDFAPTLALLTTTAAGNVANTARDPEFAPLAAISPEMAVSVPQPYLPVALLAVVPAQVLAHQVAISPSDAEGAVRQPISPTRVVLSPYSHRGDAVSGSAPATAVTSGMMMMMMNTARFGGAGDTSALDFTLLSPQVALHQAARSHDAESGDASSHLPAVQVEQQQPSELRAAVTPADHGSDNAVDGHSSPVLSPGAAVLTPAKRLDYSGTDGHGDQQENESPLQVASQQADGGDSDGQGQGRQQVEQQSPASPDAAQRSWIHGIDDVADGGNRSGSADHNNVADEMFAVTAISAVADDADHVAPASSDQPQSPSAAGSTASVTTRTELQLSVAASSAVMGHLSPSSTMHDAVDRSTAALSPSASGASTAIGTGMDLFAITAITAVPESPAQAPSDEATVVRPAQQLDSPAHDADAAELEDANVQQGHASSADFTTSPSSPSGVAGRSGRLALFSPELLTGLGLVMTPRDDTDTDADGARTSSDGGNNDVFDDLHDHDQPDDITDAEIIEALTSSRLRSLASQSTPFGRQHAEAVRPEPADNHHQGDDGHYGDRVDLSPSPTGTADTSGSSVEVAPELIPVETSIIMNASALSSASAGAAAAAVGGHGAASSSSPHPSESGELEGQSNDSAVAPVAETAFGKTIDDGSSGVCEPASQPDSEPAGVGVAPDSDVDIRGDDDADDATVQSNAEAAVDPVQALLSMLTLAPLDLHPGDDAGGHDSEAIATVMSAAPELLQQEQQKDIGAVAPDYSSSPSPSSSSSLVADLAIVASDGDGGILDVTPAPEPAVGSMDLSSARAIGTSDCSTGVDTADNAAAPDPTQAGPDVAQSSPAASATNAANDPESAVASQLEVPIAAGIPLLEAQGNTSPIIFPPPPPPPPRARSASPRKFKHRSTSTAVAAVAEAAPPSPPQGAVQSAPDAVPAVEPPASTESREDDGAVQPSTPFVARPTAPTTPAEMAIEVASARDDDTAAAIDFHSDPRTELAEGDSGVDQAAFSASAGANAGAIEGKSEVARLQRELQDAVALASSLAGRVAELEQAKQSTPVVETVVAAQPAARAASSTTLDSDSAAPQLPPPVTASPGPGSPNHGQMHSQSHGLKSASRIVRRGGGTPAKPTQPAQLPQDGNGAELGVRSEVEGIGAVAVVLSPDMTTPPPHGRGGPHGDSGASYLSGYVVVPQTPFDSPPAGPAHSLETAAGAMATPLQHHQSRLVASTPFDSPDHHHHDNHHLQHEQLNTNVKGSEALESAVQPSIAPEAAVAAALADLFGSVSSAAASLSARYGDAFRITSAADDEDEVSPRSEVKLQRPSQTILDAAQSALAAQPQALPSPTREAAPVLTLDELLGLDGSMTTHVASPQVGTQHIAQSPHTSMDTSVLRHPAAGNLQPPPTTASDTETLAQSAALSALQLFDGSPVRVYNSLDNTAASPIAASPALDLAAPSGAANAAAALSAGGQRLDFENLDGHGAVSKPDCDSDLAPDVEVPTAVLGPALNGNNPFDDAAEVRHHEQAVPVSAASAPQAVSTAIDASRIAPLATSAALPTATVFVANTMIVDNRSYLNDSSMNGGQLGDASGVNDDGSSRTEINNSSRDVGKYQQQHRESEDTKPVAANHSNITSQLNVSQVNSSQVDQMAAATANSTFDTTAHAQAAANTGSSGAASRLQPAEVSTAASAAADLNLDLSRMSAWLRDFKAKHSIISTLANSSVDDGDAEDATGQKSMTGVRDASYNYNSANTSRIYGGQLDASSHSENINNSTASIALHGKPQQQQMRQGSRVRDAGPVRAMKPLDSNVMGNTSNAQRSVDAGDTTSRRRSGSVGSANSKHSAGALRIDMLNHSAAAAVPAPTSSEVSTAPGRSSARRRHHLDAGPAASMSRHAALKQPSQPQSEPVPRSRSSSVGRSEASNTSNVQSKASQQQQPIANRRHSSRTIDSQSAASASSQIVRAQYGAGTAGPAPQMLASIPSIADLPTFTASLVDAELDVHHLAAPPAPGAAASSSLATPQDTLTDLFASHNGHLQRMLTRVGRPTSAAPAAGNPAVVMLSSSGLHLHHSSVARGAGAGPTPQALAAALQSATSSSSAPVPRAAALAELHSRQVPSARSNKDPARNAISVDVYAPLTAVNGSARGRATSVPTTNRHAQHSSASLSLGSSRINSRTSSRSTSRSGSISQRSERSAGALSIGQLQAANGAVARLYPIAAAAAQASPHAQQPLSARSNTSSKSISSDHPRSASAQRPVASRSTSRTRIAAAGSSSHDSRSGGGVHADDGSHSSYRNARVRRGMGAKESSHATSAARSNAIAAGASGGGLGDLYPIARASSGGMVGTPRSMVHLGLHSSVHPGQSSSSLYAPAPTSSDWNPVGGMHAGGLGVVGTSIHPVQVHVVQQASSTSAAPMAFQLPESMSASARPIQAALIDVPGLQADRWSPHSSAASRRAWR